MFDRANASRLQNGPVTGQAEPISDGGSASGITYSRRGKTCCGTGFKREE